jgi:hypothetical protein
MDLKRIKSAIAELQSCIDDLEGGDEKPAMPSDDDEPAEEADTSSRSTLKMKLMKYKPA